MIITNKHGNRIFKPDPPALAVVAPALRYPGGKWNIADWVISQFAPHACYVEPFGGGASVLLKKQPSDLEIYNDLDADIMNFFQILREQPDKLIRAIDLTPWHRGEFIQTYGPKHADPVERARRFYVRCYQGRGRVNEQRTGWRVQGNEKGYSSVTETWSHKPDQLRAIVQRLKLVQFENRPALKILEKYDALTTLFYVDPPYVMSERTGEVYNHEMTDQEHRDLALVLKSIRGMVILSGYHSALYDELYAGWNCIDREVRTNGGNRIECLWISPSLKQARAVAQELAEQTRDPEIQQMELFAATAG